MEVIKPFWDKNKVFILGLLSAIVLSFQQFENQEINLKAIAFAGIIAAASYLAKEWHGQGLSITGVIGNAAYVFTIMQQQGNFTWPQFILQTVILIITVAAPDPKSRSDQDISITMPAKDPVVSSANQLQHQSQ